MIVPGELFASDRVDITAGAAQTPDFINQGFGFMNDGTLAVDTDAPVGNNYTKGIRQSTVGAIYGTVVTDPSDVYLEGVRLTVTGQLVYEAGATVNFSSRNPTTAANALAVI